MVDKRKFLFDQTDTLCPMFDGHSRFRDIIIEVALLFVVLRLILESSILFHWGEIFGVQRAREFYLFEDFTKVLEGEKNRRVEGEEIFNSREYKRDVMVSARRIRLIQRKSFQYKVIRGFFACRK